MRAHPQLERVQRTLGELLEHELERDLLLDPAAQAVVVAAGLREVLLHLVPVMDHGGEHLADAGRRLEDRRIADLDERVECLVRGPDEAVADRRDPAVAQDIATARLVARAADPIGADAADPEPRCRDRRGLDELVQDRQHRIDRVPRSVVAQRGRQNVGIVRIRDLEQVVGVAAQVGLVGVAEQPVHLVRGDERDAMAEALCDLERPDPRTRGLDEDEVDHVVTPACSGSAYRATRTGPSVSGCCRGTDRDPCP